MTVRMIHRFCWSLTLALQAAAGAAQQEPPIEIPAIRLPSQTVLPGFPIGSGLDFDVDPKDFQRAGGAKELHVRIFRGSKDILEHHVYYLTGDGCLFFRAAIYPIASSARGVKVLTVEGGPDLTLDNGWLSYDPETPGSSQSFVLVFEKAPKAKDTLKLRPEDVERYFSNGLEFIVKSSRLLRADEEKALIRQEKLALAETTAIASTTLKGCRNYSRIDVTASAFLLSEPCLEDALALRRPFDPGALLAVP